MLKEVVTRWARKPMGEPNLSVNPHSKTKKVWERGKGVNKIQGK